MGEVPRRTVLPSSPADCLPFSHLSLRVGAVDPSVAPVTSNPVPHYSKNERRNSNTKVAL